MNHTPRTGLLALSSAAATLIATTGAAAAGAAGTTLHDVVAADNTPYAANTEILRRMASPLTRRAEERRLADAGATLARDPLEASTERFLIYQPAAPPPPHGFALLVFVPPWRDARLPPGWAGVLERFGTVFITAARSGNDENPIGRRVPLALLAAAEAQRRFPIDPERVYVGGFSGGSRVALRIALAYPDLFRGVILDAGSDPIGTPQVPLPPQDLLALFQSQTRLVYITGERDTEHLADDAQSIRSLHQWCVANVDEAVQPRVQHEIGLPGALSQALTRLAAPGHAEPGKLARCRAALAADLTARLHEVEELLERGATREAERGLRQIDARFGGLAAPRSVELTEAAASQPLRNR
ncbi:MAG TPA: PHB depolymerase family esterase [Steroidobacteraceae bacterium]|nr:PHB depolymerase family esterase [Steroidobacteraceae bacterium]